MRRRSRIAWIGAVLGLVLLPASAGAQFGLPGLDRKPTITTAPTTAPATAPAAEMKTAENKEHRFRVSFPPTWESKPIVQKRADLILAPVGSRPAKGFEVRPSWMVVVATGAKYNKPGANLDATVAQIMEFANSAYEGATVEQEDVKLGGDTPAKRVRYAGTRNKQRVQGDVTVALKDGKLFNLTGTSPADEFETHRPVFDQILASFEWTDGGATTQQKE